MPPVDCACWTTRLTASYLAIIAGLIAILGNTVPGRVWLVTVHLTLSGSLLILNRSRPPVGILGVVRDWHPLLLFPLLYKEVELLAAAIGDWRLTTAIPAWESALFAGQPSLYLSERLALVPLSEYLHFCYLSQVIVIPAVAAYWYVGGRRTAGGPGDRRRGGVSISLRQRARREAVERLAPARSSAAVASHQAKSSFQLSGSDENPTAGAAGRPAMPLRRRSRALKELYFTIPRPASPLHFDCSRQTCFASSP